MSRAHVRDEGLQRISSITRWVAAIGVTGTAFLAAAVYRATPGRSTSSSSQSGTTVTPTGATPPGGFAGDPNANPGGDPSGFQAPVQAPVPVQQVPIVRSGGS